jgi:hypothetical protein
MITSWARRSEKFLLARERNYQSAVVCCLFRLRSKNSILMFQLLTRGYLLEWGFHPASSTLTFQRPLI